MRKPIQSDGSRKEANGDEQSGVIDKRRVWETTVCSLEWL